MVDITIASEIVGIIVALMGALGGSIPIIQKYRSRAIKLQNFFTAMEAAWEDQKISKAELEHLYKIGKGLLT